jgi:hypothetical protein
MPCRAIHSKVSSWAFLGIGLEHQPLARAPAPRIHDGMEALGEFVLIVMRVAVRAWVEIALRPLQYAEEFTQILLVWIAANHRRDYVR